MNFKGPYVQAMREKALALFKELLRSGQMEQHLQQKSLEAHQLLDELLANEPRHPDGLVKNLNAERCAEETVMALMLEFPRA